MTFYFLITFNNFVSFKTILGDVFNNTFKISFGAIVFKSSSANA